MPNIIGEQIPKYVSTQINKRQEAHGSGQDGKERTPEQISYLNSKTAWVKLASGVSLNSKRAGDELIESKFADAQLAKKHVLFNGTSGLSNTLQTDLNGNQYYPLEQRNTFNDKYNVNATTTGFSEFGYVPMPGIESAEIKCMNRGSIKRATVKIKCYSPEQFHILDLLYMRIGYTMLLEWGNSLYLDNDGKLQEMGFTLVEDPDGFFSNSVKTYYDMLPRIKGYRVKKFGNYDALVARVVNFNWQFAQDGSYDITLELISMGDVIESLKTNVSPNPDILKLVDTAYVPSTSETTNSTSPTITPPTSNVLSSYLYYQSVLNQNPINYSTEKIYIEVQGTPTQAGHFIKPVEGEVSIPLPLETLGPHDSEAEAKQSILAKYPGAKETTSYESSFFLIAPDLLPNEYWIDTRDYTVQYNPVIQTSAFSTTDQEIKDVAFIDYKNASSNDYLFGYYMRFGHLLDFIRKYVIPNIHEGGKPVHKMLDIDSGVFNNPMYHFPFQVSLDPQVCIVNNIDEPVGTKHYFYQLRRWINPNKQEEAYTMNIYVHHQTIDKCLKDNLDERGNLSLFSFLNSICSELNKALGGVNNLEPIIDEEDNIIRIIDQSYYDPKPNSYELELYGYNQTFKSSNFVRNFNLKTEITPDFANMTSISSTAGGYVKGVENTMFSKWNKGLKDRLQPELSAPLSTNFSSSRDEVKETYLKKFWWAHKSAFGLKDQSELELDPQIIENNVSIVSEFYKSIQSEIQLNINEKYASPTNGFVPINLGVTMDGIGGIKIYNELNVSSRFLPPRYPESLHFIIKGVNHKLSNSDWETSVETISIANADTGGKLDVPYNVLHDEILKILGKISIQIVNYAPSTTPTYSTTGKSINGDDVPLIPKPVNNLKITLNKYIQKEYVPILNKIPGYNKGIKLLATVMTFTEGFSPTSGLSYKTNNPGNIHNTGKKVHSYNSLEDGIKAQLKLLKDIADGKEKNYLFFKTKSIPTSDPYPGYTFPYTGKIKQFVKIYAAGARVNNAYASNIISFFYQNTYTWVTEDTTITDLANIK